ncbi:GNAT family N-acetyltransferase [Cellulomonas fengjieae]|uniref:GNAT family N-acetyltransferase n=1 Tax=Cellulomonas fengjieae TaxID=2819978 RepID=A0ABS3SK77_9CELL|nr:GNAT family protein [Cellulomonas fengjieae]MBO3086072.1 GNAT family N-acetyltransferase [Cellulomonas fengjieae]QVI65861.1 GNAT family N-acetyltransferase [Cellulomonas fengjieae]
MLAPFTLSGRHVRLEPLSLDHVDGLAAAAAQERGSYAFTWVPDGRDETRAYVEGALEHAAGGRAVPFAVRRLSDDAIVGSTRFLDLEVFQDPAPWPPGIGVGGAPSDGNPPSVAEIGSTWYAASAQRTAVNTEAKLLLLTHAFETWGSLRVTLKTDARNAASRAAIERIGGRFEGVRRVHTVATDGGLRDTAYFSIVAAEWLAVRTGLLSRLG